MARPQLIRGVVLVALVVAGLALMNSFAPLRAPSVLVYSGLAVFLCGTLSVLLPRAWFGFSKRIHGLIAGILVGAALFLAGWQWPVRPVTTPSIASRLDALMPTYDFEECHEITVQAPPERVRAALDRITFSDIGVMQTLGTVRGIVMTGFRRQPAATGAPPSVPIVEMVKSPRSGFFPLEDTPREFVFGIAGQPWNNRAVRLSPEQFRAWAPPGTIKVAANFRIEDAGSGRSRVVTETRIVAADGTARRKMNRYWALVYPGSGMVRRSLLQAIRERAERP
jgi:hypothetical protein